jgi:hypothetical protein
MPGIQVTEEMVTRASEVLWKEACQPYMADVKFFTDEDIKIGKLKVFDDRCTEMNRDLVRRALEAALEERQSECSKEPSSGKKS